MKNLSDKIKEAKHVLELDATHRNKELDAIQTLKMSDALVFVMGDMTKEAARAYLSSIGYSDEKIKDIEK